MVGFLEMTNTRYKGSCLCQAVKYEVAAIEPLMSHCHCSMCRKFHGAAFATYGEALKNNFRWTSGVENLSNYLAENGTSRQFCKVCGSSLTFSPAHNPEGTVEFALATLDDDIPHKPDAHIFLNFKANWDEVNDDLPKFTAGRSSDKVE